MTNGNNPQLFSVCSGGSRPALTMVHGVGSSHDEWNDLLPHLPTNTDVLRYDLRGHGKSEVGSPPYQIEDFVRDHRRILARHGMDKTHVVGVSFGGMIAQAIALHAPETVDKLVLLSCVAGRTSEQTRKVKDRLAVLESGGPKAMSGASAERWFTRNFRRKHPDKVEQLLERVESNNYAGYLASYRLFAETDMVDSLAKIRHETLIMTGEGDIGSTPSMVDLMCERIPNARGVIVPSVKHAMVVEAPVRVANEIIDFLNL